MVPTLIAFIYYFYAENSVDHLASPNDHSLSEMARLTTTDLWSNKKDTVSKALKKMVNILEQSEKENFTIPTVVILGAMKKWYKNSEIQTLGCELLARTYFVDQAADFGALETVVTAMKNFPRDEFLQSVGTVALANLSSKETIQVRLALEVPNGLDVIVRAMKTFVGDKVLQEAGCATMESLSNLKMLRPAVIASGALEAIFLALKNDHDENDERDRTIQLRGRSAIHKFISYE
jgi:hypothetical protein